MIEGGERTIVMAFQRGMKMVWRETCRPGLMTSSINDLIKKKVCDFVCFLLSALLHQHLCKAGVLRENLPWVSIFTLPSSHSLAAPIPADLIWNSWWLRQPAWVISNQDSLPYIHSYCMFDVYSVMPIWTVYMILSKALLHKFYYNCHRFYAFNVPLTTCLA